ncbi:MAG TPA: 30S ribosomal protein S2 [archaeon]|nr:30S ribosomal protein S2 [archaeon]
MAAKKAANEKETPAPGKGKEPLEKGVKAAEAEADEKAAKKGHAEKHVAGKAHAGEKGAGKEKAQAAKSGHGDAKPRKMAEEVRQEIQGERSPEDEKETRQTALVETEKYLNTGAHIGTKFKSGDMKRYIYKVRKDGLNVLDVQTLDERLKFAAKFISAYPKEKIVVVSRKLYGNTPAKMFAESIGGKALTGRFVPGTFTNPKGTRFVETGIVVITDPEPDAQAILEASIVRVPVVALASTNNVLKNVDIAVPINNKGRKSLALGYWILAKEVLKERGEIKSDSEFGKTIEDFEYKMTEGEEEAARQPRFERKGRFDRDRDRDGDRNRFRGRRRERF